MEPWAPLALGLGAGRLEIPTKHSVEQKCTCSYPMGARCTNPWPLSAGGPSQPRCPVTQVLLLLPVPGHVPTVLHSGLKERLLPSRFLPLVMVTPVLCQNNSTRVPCG